MARGKQTCKILKEIRRQIAAANNIEFITSECRYKGDCPGTCPKCEAEVRYLEEQLRARSLSGKAVALAGISAGMMLMSCGNGTPAAQPGPASQSDTAGPAPQSAITATVADSVADNISDDTEEGELPPVRDTATVKKDKTRDEIVPIQMVGEIIDPAEKPFFYDNEVDVPPLFPGGKEMMYEWIRFHMIYPKSALDAGIKGKVIVQFMVKKDGTINDAKVVRHKSPDLDAEALRIVSTFPRFSPARFAQTPVDCKMNLPITFDPEKLPAPLKKEERP